MELTAILKLAQIAGPLVMQITELINKSNDLKGQDEAGARAALAALSTATDALYDAVQAKLRAAADKG